MNRNKYLMRFHIKKTYKNKKTLPRFTVIDLNMNRNKKKEGGECVEKSWGLKEENYKKNPLKKITLLPFFTPRLGFQALNNSAIADSRFE